MMCLCHEDVPKGAREAIPTVPPFCRALLLPPSSLLTGQTVPGRGEVPAGGTPRVAPRLAFLGPSNAPPSCTCISHHVLGATRASLSHGP